MSIIDHSKHRVVAEAIENALSLDYVLLKDEACGGKQRIPLFSNDQKSRKTEYCNVDLLILKDNKIKIIIEIEESDVKPTQICGKFLTSALCNYYIHNSQGGTQLVEMDNDIVFMQVVDTSGLAKNSSSKPAQWKTIENSIRKILPLKDSKVNEYWLFTTDEIDKLQETIKNRVLKTKASDVLANAKTELDKKRYSIATNLVNHALELNPENAEACKIKAESLLSQHEPDQAIECIEKAQELNLPNEEVLRLKSRALFDSGKFLECLAICEEALTDFPDDEQLWYLKGRTLQTLHKESTPAFEKALQLCDGTLAKNPDDNNTWQKKAAVLWYLGKNRETLECCERILEFDPKNEAALSVKAAALLKSKLFHESIKICDKLLKTNPEDAQSLNIKGTCLANQGKYREAIACYDRAIQLNPHDQASSSSKEQCLVALGIWICPVCKSESMKLFGNKETGYICPNAKLLHTQSKFAAIHACNGEKKPTTKSWFGIKCPNCGSLCVKFVTKDGLFVHLCPNTITRLTDGKTLVACN